MVMAGDVAQCFMEIILNQQQLGNLRVLAGEAPENCEAVLSGVDGPGQMSGPFSCRFVLWYKKHSNNTIQVRVGLVARG